MRRVFAFGTLVFAAILALEAGTSAAHAQEGRQAGEVCIVQNGVYLAFLRIGLFGSNGRQWAYQDKDSVPIGQMHCAPFLNTDDQAFVNVAVVLGHSKDCRFNLKGRTGRQVAIASGTSLNVGLICP
ncbi:hypothetical protein [Azospirillum sp.]|uniref:hypothetical protein n=1 Tax=Azospirillum sp. TaxID=34012 RepID=UPI002D44FDE5|nr:hypothetical protein [Azospirillum sp.]HYD67722.1 hypothetical protein [Azospirillum sp.]